jgi:hypothetical protein
MADPEFTEIRIAPGTILYKGLPVSCTTLLKDIRYFYLTDDQAHARKYGNVCPFRVKKLLRLFEMNHENIRKLLAMPSLSKMTKWRLETAFGTGITAGEQARRLKSLKVGSVPRSIDPNLGGQRASWTVLNKKLGTFFSQDFLRTRGYDGYYAEGKWSVFHEGYFSSEIMLTNAYQKIERTGGRLPVHDLRTLAFPQALARLFMEYSKQEKRLIRPNKEFVIFCTGGQAVNLYLRQRTRAARFRLIRQTSDFDFSFAINKPVKTLAELRRKGAGMRRVMQLHMDGFAKFINKNYKGANVEVRFKPGRRVLHPPTQVPATGRRTYLVYTWQLKVGKKIVDVADSALALYPGATRTWLSRRFSVATGVPIQQAKYQLIDALGILAGSFLHKTQVAKRNPLTGNALKGEKNMVRANQLSRVITSHAKNYSPELVRLSTKTKNLLKKIKNKNLRGARIEAATVEALVKNLVVRT